MAPGFPLVVSETTVRTSEAFYQALKFPELPWIQELILAEKSPMSAKMVAKRYAKQERPDWMDVRVEAMRLALVYKYLQNPGFQELLGQSKPSGWPIVELSVKDDFWGAKPAGEKYLVGHNTLGVLLTNLRDNLSEFLHDFKDQFVFLGKDLTR